MTVLLCAGCEIALSLVARGDDCGSNAGVVVDAHVVDQSPSWHLWYRRDRQGGRFVLAKRYSFGCCLRAVLGGEWLLLGEQRQLNDGMYLGETLLLDNLIFS